MGNGIDKFLDQYVTSKNFTPGSSFEKSEHTEGNNRSLTHRLSANFRGETDSFNLFTFNASGKLGDSKNDTRLQSESYQIEALQNRLNNTNTVWGDATDLNGTAGWTKKGRGKWPLLQAKLQGSHIQNKEESEWYNTAYFPVTQQEFNDRQYRFNNLIQTTGSASLSTVYALGNNYYIEPSLKASYNKESIRRRQGPLDYSDIVIDSLSPYFYRNALSVNPGIELKRILKKTQWNIGLQWQTTDLSSFLNNKELNQSIYHYLLPSARWQKEFGTGRRLAARYKAEVNAPGALQMLPVTDFSNPLFRVAGSTNLKPEYEHNLNLNYNRFDQFNMSSFFIMMNGSYTP
ncbi:MAG: outer membrane beta-barrel protein [Taibaiella sp.]|jgi:hypothetical protein